MTNTVVTEGSKNNNKKRKRLKIHKQVSSYYTNPTKNKFPKNYLKGYIQSKSIIYEVFVLKANASPLRSRASPMSAFFASSAANSGVSADASIVPIDSNAAARQHTELHYYNSYRT